MPLTEFATYAAIEPRLFPLAAAAQSCPDDWRDFEETVKRPMAELVGWYAGDDAPAALRTSTAYEVVYGHLVDLWERAAEAAREVRDAA